MRSKSGGGVVECVGVFTEYLFARNRSLCWMTFMKARR